MSRVERSGRWRLLSWGVVECSHATVISVVTGLRLRACGQPVTSATSVEAALVR
jgi:hypothetical protein